MNKRIRTMRVFSLLVDLACIVLSNAISILIFGVIFKKIPNFFTTNEWIRYYATLVMSYLIVFFVFHTNIDTQVRNRDQELRTLVKNATLTYTLFSVAIIMLKNPIVQSRYLLLSGYLFFTVFTMVGRFFLKRYLTGFYTKSKTASYVGVITTTDRVQEFVDRLDEDWSLNLRGIVLLDDYVSGNAFRYNSTVQEIFGVPNPTTLKEKGYPSDVSGVPVIATDKSFIDWIRSSPLDEIFINLPYSDDSELQELIEELEDMGATVHINIPMLDDILSESKFNNISCKMQYDIPMATFTAVKMNYLALTTKRAFDLVVATIGAILSLPIIAITAIPLKLESKGPLFFKQIRIGKNGRPFYIYKLRSMYADAEEHKQELMDENDMDGLMFKMDNDPRVTKVGKVIRRLSIDELPQFFNVLKGDMSIIGTRPPTVDEFERYESRHKRRLSMRPGITGMWQVSGRSEITDFEEVVKLDCQYIDEWSLLLDLRIFLKTIVVVLFRIGAK